MKYKQGSILLEAIISLVILSFMGVAMVEWLSQIVRSQARMAEELAYQNMLERSLVYMENINPMQQQQGSEDFGDYHLNWRAIPIGQAVQALKSDSTVGEFSVQRFTGELEMNRADQDEVYTAEIILLGYRRTHVKDKLGLPGV